ncbi:Murein DD-endopeptidase MepM and murein hydrolase activator NlpD, contain LysM domain [Rathayibacter oskolensis]|uniref:Murein DD-endopeptidase MepM and murein hydrolase activator NlpD, contain LysM domain n=1 Tax=Rathayibacter oskolensis TaxID=1891671 RepID=A0A1X7P595_9MICO|nr:M23 family metallopeptidase [Rathayibacter oskolensis]SMH45418.1 Murein DD-endopeptidase MepM and murein hydrolase activator NlpD, contain LysM domain [Rathayibacter oskolensis]
MSPDSPAPAASASTLGESTPPLSRRELRERERAAALAAEVASDGAVSVSQLQEAERRVAASRRTPPAPVPAPRVGALRPAQGGRRLGGLVALSFAAAIIAATSVPATSLLTAEDVQAQSMTSVTGGQERGSQSFVAGEVGAETASRDGFGVQERKTQTNVADIGRTSDTGFTNDPNASIQWPFAVGVPVGDRFGYRNCAGCSVNHGGTDFNPGDGSPIQSIADGVVRTVVDGEGSLGVHVIVDHEIDGELVSSVYAHMQHGSAAVSEGDPVKVGQLLGLVGTTGMSTGPHLHFEIRLDGTTKVDSYLWLKANANR